MKTAISSKKKTKQQHKYLLYILKLLKTIISFITSDYFGLLCPFVFLMSASKTSIGVFLVLSKVSVLVHFH